MKRIGFVWLEKISAADLDALKKLGFEAEVKNGRLVVFMPEPDPIPIEWIGGD